MQQLSRHVGSARQLDLPSICFEAHNNNIIIASSINAQRHSIKSTLRNSQSQQTLAAFRSSRSTESTPPRNRAPTAVYLHWVSHAQGWVCSDYGAN
jgi:hypothetical protein